MIYCLIWLINLLCRSWMGLSLRSYISIKTQKELIENIQGVISLIEKDKITDLL